VLWDGITREHFDLEFSKEKDLQKLLRKEKLTFENSQLKKKY